LLIDAGVLTETRLQAALSEQRRWGGRLGRALVDMGFVDEAAMVNALSTQLGLPVVDLDSLTLPATITQLLRVDLAERYGIFPLASDPKTRSLQVATSDPTNFDALKELSLQTHYRVHAAVCTASQIDRAIRRYYYGELLESPTTSPRAFGVFEASFDLMQNEPPLPPPPSAPKPMPPPPRASGPRPLGDEMSHRLKALEDITQAQTRALRALIELLIESGLISRDEYLGKMNAHQTKA
jgi:type IV pilus assembly protein PilB